ncbi:MAG: DUF3786 domain-containing protein [Desulfobacterales bacterium]|nr:DUF3786 domain-containing protein [Desulfobacterales bacterium]MDX2511866.1 DUF3786 domain-containing protein [Desulfobacterales bacterium]
MTDQIAPIHYRELEEREPGEVCQRSGCRFDRERQCYELEIWGEVYNIFPHERRIQRSFKEGSRVHEYLSIFIIHYLLTPAEMVVENEWISEKDIPGGPTFFRGPHAIPTGLITKTFQNDIEAFDHRCKFLRGEYLDMGDAAFQFQIARHIPAVVLYWLGDDDFPPEAKLLFDRSISRHLASDVIYALAVEMCARIGGSQ